MPEKYSCPKCGKELDEKYVFICICPHCHGIFDKPTIQQVSQEDQEKEHLGEEGSDKKIEEEHEELPPKTINKVQLLALFSLLIILAVSYFTINKTATNKKATQEGSRLAVQGETLQAKKLQEAEDRVKRAEKLQQETEKTLEETRLTAQKEEEKQFQYYYDKGETAFRNGSYVDALESYQKALAYRPGDQKTQEKINLTFAKLKVAQETKQAEPKLQETITAERMWYKGKGFDIIQAGDNQEKILRIFGDPEGIIPGVNYFGHSSQILYRRKYGIEFGIDTKSGIIMEIKFNIGFDGHLENGLKIGDSLEEVLKKYGGALETVVAGHDETQGVTLGTNRVLYEQVISGKIINYKFINAKKGVVFLFDRDKKTIGIVVFRLYY